MIEVFKTNVNCPFVAHQIMADILVTFVNVEVSFDLEDVDRILRLSFEKRFIALDQKVAQIVRDYECSAQLLVEDFREQTFFEFSIFTTKNISVSALKSIL